MSRLSDVLPSVGYFDPNSGKIEKERGTVYFSDKNIRAGKKTLLPDKRGLFVYYFSTITKIYFGIYFNPSWKVILPKFNKVTETTELDLVCQGMNTE